MLRLLRSVHVFLLYSWRRLGQIRRHSTWGYCLRCGVPWGGRGKAEYHQTWFGKKLSFSKGTYGLFPLCQACWTELGTAARRLPFYRMLLRKWKKVGASGEMTQWEEIERAVRKESDELGHLFPDGRLEEL